MDIIFIFNRNKFFKKRKKKKKKNQKTNKQGGGGCVSAKVSVEGAGPVFLCLA